MEEIEQFVVIPEFPDYMVSNFGRFFNIHRPHRILILSPTEFGIPTVGLVGRDGYQYRRSAKVIVARAFVPGEDDFFNTAIQLDMDRWNLNANNMCWRPRGFAKLYSIQFWNREPWFFTGPIFDVTNEIEYKTIFDAALENGNLCRSIRRSIYNDIPVFPGGEYYIY